MVISKVEVRKTSKKTLYFFIAGSFQQEQREAEVNLEIDFQRPDVT